MKHVRRPELDLDLEAVKTRLDAAVKCRTRDPVGVMDPPASSLFDVMALLMEIKRLLWIEREHRHEFADLLAAARASLGNADAGEKFALLRLRTEVNRHDEITAEDLDEWRDWSDLVDAAPHTPKVRTLTPTERRR